MRVIGISQESLKAVVHYNSETGVFTRLTTSNQHAVGEVAGGPAANGYWRICILGKRTVAHRLAWLYVYGVWPNEELDHKNRKRLDNRIDNLREATNCQNKQNSIVHKNNVSGQKGVSKRGDLWRARISNAGIQHYLGLYDTIEAARTAYCAAAREYHTHNPEGNLICL